MWTHPLVIVGAQLTFQRASESSSDSVWLNFPSASAHVISYRGLQRKQPVSCAGDRSIRARVLCSPCGEDRSVKQEERETTSGRRRDQAEEWSQRCCDGKKEQQAAQQHEQMSDCMGSQTDYYVSCYDVTSNIYCWIVRADFRASWLDISKILL